MPYLSDDNNDEYYFNMYNELYKLYGKRLKFQYSFSYYDTPLATREYTKDFHIDITEYFKEEIDSIFPNTPDKTLYKEELFVPLMMFVHRIKDARYIRDDAPIEVKRKFISTT